MDDSPTYAKLANGVKQAVENGKIDKERYNRYVEMFETLKADFVKKHG